MALLRRPTNSIIPQTLRVSIFPPVHLGHAGIPVPPHGLAIGFFFERVGRSIRLIVVVIGVMPFQSGPVDQLVKQGSFEQLSCGHTVPDEPVNGMVARSAASHCIHSVVVDFKLRVYPGPQKGISSGIRQLILWSVFRECGPHFPFGTGQSTKIAQQPLVKVGGTCVGHRCPSTFRPPFVQRGLHEQGQRSAVLDTCPPGSFEIRLGWRPCVFNCYLAIISDCPGKGEGR